MDPSDRKPVPIYEQPQDNVIHVNNNQIPMPGTEVIKGNIPRTITGYWKTVAWFFSLPDVRRYLIDLTLYKNQ